MKKVIWVVLGLTVVLYASPSVAASRRVLECAGVNPSVRGCDGYFRLYVFETGSGTIDKAMLYHWTVMNSSQTWRGEATLKKGAVKKFSGKNGAGGSVELKVNYGKAKTLRVPKPACLPEAVQKLVGHPATLDYVVVFKPAGAPEKREAGEDLKIVCRPLKKSSD